MVLYFHEPTQRCAFNAKHYARSTGFTHENVNIFYDNLDNAYDKYKVTPNRIINVDETGIIVVQSKTPKIVVLKGKDSGALLSN